ncbi:MAG: Zn-ribbon domain-containing OB-fold protein [Thermoplasmata archaeon]|nr:Zn-ribbon domain-containing OB-fold protein [Thermoplasmata archaeon]
MTFLEKQTDPTTPMHWTGDMQADYFYSNGVAGDRFFKHLMKKDTFLASECPECGVTFIPPRLYCEDCFCGIPDDKWVEVKAQGVIRTNTTAMIDAHNEPLEEPVVMALIEIDDTDGAMLGRIKTDMLGMDLAGLMVKAKLRPRKDREGTMKDILYFEPY